MKEGPTRREEGHKGRKDTKGGRTQREEGHKEREDFICFHPTYFPNKIPVGQKSIEHTKKVSYIFVLIPSTTACYLTIAGYGFFWALTGPYPTLRFGGACGLGMGAF
jgi:hypothetical protein